MEGSGAMTDLNRLTRNTHRTRGPAKDADKDSTADGHATLSQTHVTNGQKNQIQDTGLGLIGGRGGSTHACTGLQYV